MNAPLTAHAHFAMVRAAHLAQEIKHELALAEKASVSQIEHSRRAGELLIEARKELPHGAWLPWLAENFEWAETTAYRYMKLARHWFALKAHSPRVAEMSLRHAWRMSLEGKPVPCEL